MLLASLRFLIGLYILVLLSFQYFVYNFYLFLHIWKDNKIIFYLVSCTLQHLCFRLSLWVLFNYSTSFSCWRNVIFQYKTTEQHSVWHTSDSFSVVQTKDRSSYLSFFKLMSTSYRNGVKALFNVIRHQISFIDTCRHLNYTLLWRNANTGNLTLFI